MSKNFYFTKLDSIRTIAFFMVFLQHGFGGIVTRIKTIEPVQFIIKKLTMTGGVGVHMFFVISGFLITFLMIEEEKLNQKINLKSFYIRRILRIWPLYYLVLLFSIFLIPLVFNWISFDGSIIKTFLFLNNFDRDFGSVSIGAFWSVAIEEQFYLFWPVFFIFIKNKKTLTIFCLILAVLSVFFILSNIEISYYHTFGNIVYLMVGCIGAIYYSSNKTRVKVSFITKKASLLIFILIILFFILYSKSNTLLFTLNLIILPVCYLFIVLNVVSNDDGEKPTKLSILGKYTYGMYLYHTIIIFLIRVLFDLINLDYLVNPFIGVAVGIISLVITVFVSIISYEYFEKRFLKYKNKFSVIKTRL